MRRPRHNRKNKARKPDLSSTVRQAFDREGLRRICQMHEDEFAAAYDLHPVKVEQRWPSDRYFYRDNGSDILFVAHLDTVVDHEQRQCGFLDTANGPIVYSGALDDRLGAYIGLELLPSLGITHDFLLTTGEENGQSTAAYFEPRDHHEREYNWVIEFDRGGSDVVMYQYEDAETKRLVADCGARVAQGIFSDISYLEHLEVKAFNWGVGYQDYHSVRGHAWLDDTYAMVGHYLRFHETNAGEYLPHEKDPLDYTGGWWGGGRGLSGGGYGSASGYAFEPYTAEECESWGYHQEVTDHEEEDCPTTDQRRLGEIANEVCAKLVEEEPDSRVLDIGERLVEMEHGAWIDRVGGW